MERGQRRRKWSPAHSHRRHHAELHRVARPHLVGRVVGCLSELVKLVDLGELVELAESLAYWACFKIKFLDKVFFSTTSGYSNASGMSEGKCALVRHDPSRSLGAATYSASVGE